MEKHCNGNYCCFVCSPDFRLGIVTFDVTATLHLPLTPTADRSVPCLLAGKYTDLQSLISMTLCSIMLCLCPYFVQSVVHGLIERDVTL